MCKKYKSNEKKNKKKYKDMREINESQKVSHIAMWRKYKKYKKKFTETRWKNLRNEKMQFLFCAKNKKTKNKFNEKKIFIERCKKRNEEFENENVWEWEWVSQGPFRNSTDTLITMGMKRRKKKKRGSEISRQKRNEKWADNLVIRFLYGSFKIYSSIYWTENWERGKRAEKTS